MRSVSKLHLSLSLVISLFLSVLIESTYYTIIYELVETLPPYLLTVTDGDFAYISFERDYYIFRKHHKVPARSRTTI